MTSLAGINCLWLLFFALLPVASGRNEASFALSLRLRRAEAVEQVFSLGTLYGRPCGAVR